MKLEDIKIGMKVKIPKTKSVGCRLLYCSVIELANRIDQNFLYIIGTEVVDNITEILVSSENNTGTGDYFLPEDLEPYEEPISLDLTSKNTVYKDSLGNTYPINEHQKDVLNTIYKMNLDYDTTILVMRYLLDNLNKLKNAN